MTISPPLIRTVFYDCQTSSNIVVPDGGNRLNVGLKKPSGSGQTLEEMEMARWLRAAHIPVHVTYQHVLRSNVPPKVTSRAHSWHE